MIIRVSNRKNSYGKIYIYIYICGNYEMLQVNDRIIVKYNGVKIFKTINNDNNWHGLKRMIDKANIN